MTENNRTERVSPYYIIFGYSLFGGFYGVAVVEKEIHDRGPLFSCGIAV